MLLAAISAGNSLPTAARLAGVNPKTLAEWMRRGRGLDGRPATPAYVELVAAVEYAQAEAEAAAVRAIRKAMHTNWRAAVWYLETISPEWRRSKERPKREARAPAPASNNFGVVVVDRATLKRLSGKPLRTISATVSEGTPPG